MGRKGNEQELNPAEAEMQIRLRRQKRVTLESVLTLPKEIKLHFEINEVMFKYFKEENGKIEGFFSFI